MAENRKLQTTFDERQDLTRGPILKKMVMFALPMILSNLVFQCYNAADSAIVGNFVGSDALAAVSASNPIMMLFNALFFGLSIGTGIVVAQNFGANRLEDLRKAINSSALMGIIVGTFIIIAGSITARPLLNLLKTPANIIEGSNIYLSVIYFGMLSNTLYQIGAGILRAMGDSRTPLYFLCISAMSNVVLDLLFVAVLNMGVMGAALATILTQTLSAIMVLFRINSGKYPICIEWKHLSVDRNAARMIIRLGVPSAIQNASMSLGAVFIQSFANKFGSAFIAANSVVQKTDGFMILPMLGYGGALTTFVGQNMGAGRADRAKKGIVLSFLIILIYGILLGTFLWFFGSGIMRIFTQDMAVLSISTVGIRILAFFYLFMGMNQSLTGAMRGAGAAVAPMMITIISQFMRIPVAYFIAVVPMNPFGLFWSMAFSVLANFLMGLGYFKFGNWQKKTEVQPSPDTPVFDE